MKRGGSSVCSRDKGRGRESGWVLLLLLLLCLSLVGLQLLFSSNQILPIPLPLPFSFIQRHTRNNTSCHLGAFGDKMVSMLPPDLPFTLFLPSPSSFQKILRLDPATSLAPDTATLNNTLAILSRVLAFSAVPQLLPARGLPVRMPISVDAVSGLKLLAWRDLDGTVVVNGIRSECVNIRKGELIVHVIAGVLMDPEFEQSFFPDYEEDT
ncbi:Periostin [Rhynchospora pubera]|uniref:Periostin n=1 Tax=Rhynchospora pubera TaxID=906938 RepID=A0AAV8GSU1_9POAL|nr:Periostin [Rhynchospora pubera]